MLHLDEQHHLQLHLLSKSRFLIASPNFRQRRYPSLPYFPHSQVPSTSKIHLQVLPSQTYHTTVTTPRPQVAHSTAVSAVTHARKGCPVLDTPVTRSVLSSHQHLTHIFHVDTANTPYAVDLVEHENDEYWLSKSKFLRNDNNMPR